jgi:hypothetical protein
MPFPIPIIRREDPTKLDGGVPEFSQASINTHYHQNKCSKCPKDENKSLYDVSPDNGLHTTAGTVDQYLVMKSRMMYPQAISFSCIAFPDSLLYLVKIWPVSQP